MLYQPINIQMDINGYAPHLSLIKPMVRGDEQAHEIVVTIMDGDKPADLSGMGVKGVFVDGANNTIDISTSAHDAGVSLTGNVARIVVPNACYNNPGMVSMYAKLIDGSTSRVVRTVAMITGTCIMGATDSYVGDPTFALPNLETYHAIVNAGVEEVTRVVGTIPADYSALSADVKHLVPEMVDTKNTIKEQLGVVVLGWALGNIYIAGANLGKEGDATNWCRSQFMPIGSDTYTVVNNTAYNLQVIEHNSAKTGIRYKDIGAKGTYTYTRTDANVAYFRFRLDGCTNPVNANVTMSCSGALTDSIVELKSDLSKIYIGNLFDYAEWEKGTLFNGVQQDADNRLRTKMFETVNGKTIRTIDGYSFNLHYYDENKQYKSNFNTFLTQYTLESWMGKYYRIVLRRDDNEPIATDEHINIIYDDGKEEYNKIADIDDKLNAVASDVYKLYHVESALKATWENGSINVDGTEIASDTRIRTDYITTLEVGQTLTAKEGYKFNYHFYDKDKHRKGGIGDDFGWQNSYTIDEAHSGVYYRVVVAKTDDSIIAPSEHDNITYSKQVEAGRFIDVESKVADIEKNNVSYDNYLIRGIEKDKQNFILTLDTADNKYKPVASTTILGVSENLLVKPLEHDTVIDITNVAGQNINNRLFGKKDGEAGWTDYGRSGYASSSQLIMIPADVSDLRIYPFCDDTTFCGKNIEVKFANYANKVYEKRIFMDCVKEYSSTDMDGATNLANGGSVAEIYAIFDGLMAQHPNYVTRRILGKDASKTYEIREYTFKPQTVGYYNHHFPAVETKNEVKLPLFLVHGCIHGAEELGTWIVAKFFEKLCNHWTSHSTLEFYRWNAEFKVIPIVNPWGYQNNDRLNSLYQDINRQFLRPDEGLEANCVEALILRNWLIQNKDRAYAYIDCHTAWADKDRDVAWYISPDNHLDELSNSVITRLTRLWKKKYPVITYDGLMGYVGKATYVDESIYNAQSREYAYYYLGYKNAITFEIADTVQYGNEQKFGVMTTNMYMDIFVNMLVGFAQMMGASLTE